MSRAGTSKRYQLVERNGPAGRRILRQNSGDRKDLFVIAGFRGADWPGTLTNPRIDALPGTTGERPSWRLSSDEGSFDFGAIAVERVETRPELYFPLHRRFALTTADRLAVRVLLWLLRLPGGARLLRGWHARRNR